MKIIFSSNSSWSVYNFRQNLLTAFTEKGYEVYIIAPDGEYLQKLSELGYKTKSIEIDNSSKSIFSNIKLLFDLYRLYKLIKPDVVLHNAIKPNIYGAIICRILRIPVINNISGLGAMFMSHNFSSYIGKQLYKFSQQKVNHIFFQNSSDLSLFLSKKIVKIEQCSLIPGSGVDLDRFRPRITDQNNGTTKFCYVGRLLGDKGIYEFIEAAQKIKSTYSNVEFYILGELYLKHPTSVSREKLEEWIESGLVIFLGKSDHVENELYKFDCIVLPSYREGLSRVLLEASSMGIPAITSNVPGCIDVIEDGRNGFICKVKDSEDLYYQMRKFLSIPKEERIKMGKYGREKVVKKFDERFVIAEYLNVIEQLN